MEIVEFVGAVVILPLIQDQVVLLRQYRPTVGDWIYEIPAGTLKPGEDPYECARRELEEETGYRPGRLVKMFEMYTSPGYSTEKLHAFLALDLQEGTPHLEAGEEITVAITPMRKVLEMIRKNQIRDAKTIATILYYQNFRRGLA